MGAANVPIDNVVRSDVDDEAELFFDEEEERRYQMPLEGQNFKRNNKLVYKLLKAAACHDTNACWPWI